MGAGSRSNIACNNELLAVAEIVAGNLQAISKYYLPLRPRTNHIKKPGFPQAAQSFSVPQQHAPWSSQLIFCFCKCC